MKSQLLLYLLSILSISSNCEAQVKADDIVGTWLTTGKEPAKIQIYKSAEKYYGKIVWLKNPTTNGKKKVDSNNPDKNRQSQPIIGMVILRSFKFESDEWSDGTIYDPESGKTYDCNIIPKDKNILKVRGFIGISLFGRTEVWTRSTL